MVNFGGGCAVNIFVEWVCLAGFEVGVLKALVLSRTPLLGISWRVHASCVLLKHLLTAPVAFGDSASESPVSDNVVEIDGIVLRVYNIDAPK